MHYYEVALNRIIRSGQDTFTYASSEPLAIGTLVRVPIGKTQANGIITEAAKKPSYPTKDIARTLEPVPLPLAAISLARWLSSYYVTPLATVLQTMLPTGLEKKRRPRRESTIAAHARDHSKHALTVDQQKAVATISSASPGTTLLHGITGSGKTAVYVELAQRCIASGKSVIILVPEIALTSQLVAEFSHHFDDILLTHSRQTESERHFIWREALSSTTPRLVVGPRSALFLPLPSIGLICIDEAHEPSYKQEQAPRYSALRAASTLAKSHAATLVLGSATPSVADYYVARQQDRPIVNMHTLARKGSVKPTIATIDMTKRTHFSRHRFLSDTLLKQIEQTHANGHQSLIFHNRRGSTSVTLCEQCGWQAGCPRCFIPLTLHADHHHLRCHICGLTSRVPSSCPECQHVNIVHKGIGTKLVEAELRRIFPALSIARFDGDSSNDDTVEARYSDLYNGSIDIIIGTQVIAKGLDLPRLRSVGIIQADAGLSLPDYASAERTFQLLAQTIGRVGRSQHDTNVVVQSYQPTHPIITAGIAQDYAALYKLTLKQRKHASFPPYSYLLKLTCSYKSERTAVVNSKNLAAALRTVLQSEVEVLGPTPAFYERVRDTYRWQLVLKSPKRAELVAALKHLPTTHWQYELDPASLL